MAPLRRHIASRGILGCISELKDYPNEELAPYEEFSAAGRTYYFTPGGSLYRKDPNTEESDRRFGVPFGDGSRYGGRRNTDG